MSKISSIHFPTTFSALLQLKTEDLSFSATWKDYLNLLEVADYNMEFDNNIIYPKCFVSDAKATISTNIIAALVVIYKSSSNFSVRASNRPINIPEYQKIYVPDAQVINGKPIFHILRNDMDANANPWLVVEVLSPNTAKKDWSKKLPFYKKIPSLKYILYIEQDRPFVSVFTRKGKSSKWENIDYDNLKDIIKIEEVSISLKKIYNKINFIEKETL